MKRWMRRSFVFLFFFCLCFMPEETVQAADSGEKLKVLVPLMNDSGFVTYKDGEFSGYYIDYLTEIAKYTGWDYEFVPIESSEDLLRVSENGGYDLMTGIVYSEEYDARYYEYPRHAVGAKRYVLTVPKDSGLRPDSEYSYLRGLRIGIAKNTDITELEERFRNFCRMYGISCESDLAAYPQGVNFIHIDPSAWQEKLADGSIDGILASDTFCLSKDMFALTAFGLDQIYFVAPNGRSQVISLLDAALTKISSFDPEYNDRLYEKYFAGNMEFETVFNSEEQRFLEEERTWKAAMLKEYAPYSYINDKGGQAGLAKQVLDWISEKAGGKLRFEYVYYDSKEEALAAVRDGICQINGISTYSLLEKKNIDERRSMSYYTDSYMYYKNTRWNAERSRESALALAPPAKALSDCETGEDCMASGRPFDCLAKVEAGEFGYTMMLSRLGDYYRSYYGYNDLLTDPVEKGEVMFCFAYSSTMDSEGIAIIDKCLTGINKDELDSYVKKVSLFEHKEETIWDYIKAHMTFFTLMLAGFLLLVCVLLIVVVVNMKRNSSRIYDLLYKDEVTGGMSYRKFMEAAGQRIRRPGKWMLLYMNISGFKYINDVFGYGQGNSVLRELADYFRTHIPEQLFARVYADRFVGLVSYSDAEAVKQVLDADMEELENICREKFPSFNTWIKIGAYAVRKEDDIQKAVNLANYAVDEIQGTSKNDYSFYDEEMHDRVLTQKEIEKDMRGAMENGEFEAFYQPKYNIETKKLIGAEALVRWRHPVKGLLSPGVFIPIFEKNHFIIQIDYYIFECVCRFIRKLMQSGLPCFPISSNFSRLHLNKPDFVDQLAEIVNRYQVPPEYLEIEITETVAVEDFDQLITTVKKLKEKGFQVSIDDFGSGHSSVQLLYKLPIDVLKFDKSFVDNENASGIESELVDSIIEISCRNGIKIICEGVETREQEEFVREHHCVLVQGFLYAKPMPESEFCGLMEMENGDSCL